MKNYKNKLKIFMICTLSILVFSGCTKNKEYTLKESVEVAGRQGIATDKEYYYVSGSTTLTKYDKDWNVVIENTDPFSEGYTAEVNHIGDIDVYNNEIYCGVEMFVDGVATNIQIAVYDADTLKLKRTFPFEEESGQTECSGITVNTDNSTVWMCSWTDGESGRYLYEYDLNSGEYLGKVHMHAVPQWIQGIVYYDGSYYVSADDGDADYDEPDHIYRFDIEDNKTDTTSIEELSLDDVTKQGEIEGLTFDEQNKQLLVLYNRGAKIIQGMPSGFYDGYTKEIHEVYLYDISK
jgi:5-oxoprolinase (ATP-hydrolysing) subunit C